ncbi:hypothetical protein UP17_25300 (plasmid) [Peribacillus simplex]|uniref:hypothetical protein n=1 Tax=Peribacillus simplex TaxID=1478 RepID=UPI000777A0A3|nr:hypothetical protein [Peribacillus simplex]AMM95758.1 hypothetical protein UP17_25300 [Peribacillus simplex]
MFVKTPIMETWHEEAADKLIERFNHFDWKAVKSSEENDLDFEETIGRDIRVALRIIGYKDTVLSDLTGHHRSILSIIYKKIIL